MVLNCGRRYGASYYIVAKYRKMQPNSLKFVVGYRYGDHKIIYITIVNRDLKP